MADSESLRINLEINAAIEARQKLLAKQSDSISQQIDLMIELNRAMKGDSLERSVERVSEIRAGMAAAADAAARAAGSVDSLSSSIDSADKEAEKLKKSTMSLEKAMAIVSEQVMKLGKGVLEAFSFGTASVQGFISGISSVVDGIFNITKALINIPLTIFDTMLGQAADLANASYDIAVAMEEVRKQFGDIKRGFSLEVIQGGMKDMAKELGTAGLSIGKVFGLGPEGVANAIRESLSMAVALGPSVNLLGRKFKDAAGDLLVFKKGLGLSDEDMKTLINHSKAMGTNFNTEMTKMATIAEDMADTFGMSQKDIARDMAFLTTQSGKFGRLTKKEMATASVSVRSFGLELKDVVGIMDQFADFESAATNASKLAQSFGAIIDPMRMMKEENPAKQFEYLRQQMMQAGASAENMNKAQIKQLATLTGMDENLVRTAFSASNVGKSYEEIQKEADKSGQKQKTQAEIFEQLGKNIERVVEQLQHSGSFMQEFLTGFGEGISRAAGFKGVLKDLASALKAVRQFGREMGKMFVEVFPGVREMLGGLADFFDPRNFKNNINGLKASFKEFFLSLNKDPKAAFEKFYDAIKKKFFDMFDPKSTASSKFTEGAKKFAKTITGIVSGMIVKIGETLAEGLKAITDFIKDPSALSGEAGSFANQFIVPILLSLKDSAQMVGNALLDLIGAIWEKYGPTIIETLATVFAIGFGLGLVKGLISLAFSSTIAIASAALSKILTSIITGAAPEEGVSEKIGDLISKILSGIVEGLKNLNTASLGQAAKTLFMASATLMLALGLFILELGVVAKLIESLKLTDKAIMQLAKITAIGIGALIGAALAALLLLVAMPDGGIAASTALAISLVFMAAVGAWLYAFSWLINASKDLISMETIDQGIGILVVALKSITLIAGIAAMVAGAAVAMIVAINAIGIMIISLAWLASLTTLLPLALVGVGIAMTVLLGIAILADAIVAWINASPSLDVGKATAYAITLATVLGTVGAVIIAAIAIGTAVIASAGIGFAAIVIGFSIMKDAMSVIAENVPSIISSLLKSVEGVPASDLEGKVKAVTDIITSLGGLLAPIQAAAEMAGSGSFLDGANFNGIILVFKVVGDFVSKTMDKAKEVVNGLITMTSGLTETQIKGVEVGAKILGALTGAISAVGSILSNFKVSEDVDEDAIKASSNAMKSMLPAIMVFIKSISGNVSGILNTMLAAVSGIKTRDTKGLQAKFNLIATAIDVFSSFVGAYSSTAESTKGIDDVSTALGKDGTLGKAIKAFADSLKTDGPLGSLLTAINGISFDTRTLDKKFSKIQSVFKIIESYADLAKTASEFKKEYEGTISAILTDATADINQLDALLADLQIDSMDVTVDKLSKKLQVHREKIEMDHKPINITINMGVTFKAEEFVTDIFKVSNSLVKKGNKEVKDLITKFHDPTYSPDGDFYDGKFHGLKY